MATARLRSFTQADQLPLTDNLTIVGYGNLGRSFALNLRDAGAAGLRIGNIDDDYAVLARQDGFAVTGIAEAARAADVVVVLLPDEVIPEVFAADIGPNLAARAGVVFASGYCLAFNLVTPPAASDVMMLAPRMGGEAIRQRYQQGSGFHSFLSVEQDASGRAWPRLLGLAGAVGALRDASFQLDARGEANLDLFVEQTLGAVVGFSIMSAFAVGVDKGLPAEALALELYMSGEMEAVWSGFRTHGFQQSAASHGATAQFGGLVRSMQLLQTGLYQQFEQTWEEIRNGQFAGQFQEERKAGYPLLQQVQVMMGAQLDPITEAEKQLRARLRHGGQS